MKLEDVLSIVSESRNLYVWEMVKSLHSMTGAILSRKN